MCDWQVVIEAPVDKDNERITSHIFLKEAMNGDTSC